MATRQRIDPRKGYAMTTTTTVSIIGPAWLADGVASVVLIGMHLAVGVVLIAGFNRPVSG
jgi:Family of unknown function (DUF6069)